MRALAVILILLLVSCSVQQAPPAQQPANQPAEQQAERPTDDELLQQYPDNLDEALAELDSLQ